MRALAAAAILVAGAVFTPATPAPAADAGVRTVVLTAHYSHWSLRSLTVPAGTAVRFVVRNTDPIDHELIVGDAAVQDRHERGTEATHPPRPGEISIPSHSTRFTAVVFSRPGHYFFGCHLPGHWAYGMHGPITVNS